MYKKVSKIHMIIMVILLVAVCGLAIIIRNLFMNTTEPSKGTFVVDDGVFLRSENVIILVSFSIALILLLFFTIIAFIFENRRFKKKGKAKLITGKRFTSLMEIDEKYSKENNNTYAEEQSLDTLCENFRNYAASKLGLYYEMDDIRSFIASFGVSKLIVMQGLSGTGKTSLATAFGEFLMNKSTVISIQPMWKERSDVIGYYNEFTKKFTESTLLKVLYEARYSKDIFIVVLDEMNIARVEYYFADFLSQLELKASDRYIEIVSDRWGDDPLLFEDGKLRLPENVWFIGTANNDDSTFAISDKVYDRSMLMNLNNIAKPFAAADVEGSRLTYDSFVKLFAEAKEAKSITKENKQKLNQLDQYLIKHFQITYGNRMMKQLEDFVPIYVACGGREVDAIDDFFYKKVLRKLDNLSSVVVRNASEGLLNEIVNLFGKDEMGKTKTYLRQIGTL